jgi:TPR repeat protein
MAATSAKADPALPTNEAVPTIAAAPSLSPADAAPAANTALAKALPEARPTATDTAALVSRGDTLFGLRDIVSARLFYERAANAGNAQAAIRLGETFDPSFLARAGLSGVRGDPAVAVHWYRRARELGANEADVLATSIEGKPEP